MENLSLGSETRTVVDRIEHVHLAVADLERSIVFYRDVFGFELRYDSPGPSGRCAHVGTDRFYIALSETGPVAGDGGFYHLGFTASASLEEFEARLAAAGVPVLDRASRKEGWAVYLEDPDGHEIEVVGYERGYAYA